MDEFLYRYDDVAYSPGIDEFDNPFPGSILKIELSEYKIIKRTNCGVWINLYGGILDSCRFVLLGAKKRFACPTKEEAMESFVKRKERQIKILSSQLDRTRKALQLIKLKRGL